MYLAPCTVAVHIHRDKIRTWTRNLAIVLIANEHFQPHDNPLADHASCAIGRGSR